MKNRSKLTSEQLLSLIPQQQPFRFVDEILEISSDKIVAKYTFRKDEFFYAGHFPNKPITPGVILIEAMAQISVVAMSGFLLSQEESIEHASKSTPLLTDSDAEFFKMVLPEQTVIIHGEKMFWRKNKIQSKAEMTYEDGSLIARATISGMRVQND